jgi:hypothetical protein
MPTTTAISKSRAAWTVLPANSNGCSNVSLSGRRSLTVAERLDLERLPSACVEQDQAVARPLDVAQPYSLLTTGDTLDAQRRLPHVAGAG